VKATTRAILELADHLVCQGIERIVVESTSDYWRPFYYLLQARGLCVWLVNAAQVRHAPGRPKSDKIDAVWPAKLGERGMVTLRSPGRDPPDPGLDPDPLRPGRRPHPRQAAQRKAAGRRADQAVDRGHRSGSPGGR
jgi:hypothetical protein